ncbi:MAG TPA: hypothetical protein VGJ86_05255 [Acidimicrobiales bacterium]|jgi:hypothetical protein
MPATPGGSFAIGGASLSDDGTRIAYGQHGPPDALGNATYGVVVADTAGASVVATVSGGMLSHQGQSSFDVALSDDGTTAGFLFVNFQIGTLHRFELDQPQLVPILDDLRTPGSLRVSDDGGVFALIVESDFVVTDAAGSPPRTVSADTVGNPATGVDRLVADLSGDGRFVAFTSTDPDLTPNDTNNVADIFTRATTQSPTTPT